ncbi:unnamed protein product [Urochloa humidicola]
MELNDMEEEDEESEIVNIAEEEKLELPEDWISEISKQAGQNGSFLHQPSEDEEGENSEMTAVPNLTQESRNTEPEEKDNKEKLNTRKKKWGPVIAERRSKRGTSDGRTKAKGDVVLEGALEESGGFDTKLANCVSNGEKGGDDGVYRKVEAADASDNQTTKLMTKAHRQDKKVTNPGALNMEGWLEQTRQLEEAMGDEGQTMEEDRKVASGKDWPLCELVLV